MTQCANIRAAIAQNEFKGTYGTRHARLWMRASCAPRQWVPYQYCISQFYHICAVGDKKGQGKKKYGRNGCQEWYVNPLLLVKGSPAADSPAP